MVIPSRLGRSATAPASARTYAAVDATTSGSVNMLRRCQLSSQDGTKSKLDRCPCRASTLTSSPNDAGEVDDRRDVVEGLLPDECAVRLDDRPEREDPHVVGAERRDRPRGPWRVSDREKSSHEWNQPTEGV